MPVSAKEPPGNKYSMSPCSSRVNRVVPVPVEAVLTLFMASSPPHSGGAMS